MDAKQLLFVAPLAKDGGPLFSSQRDLAEELVAVKGGGFERNRTDNVRIFIGQVLKPASEPGARPFSKNLRRALPQAIASRAADPLAAVDAIVTAIEALKNPDLHKRPFAEDRVWKDFLDETVDDAFRRVVIITIEPAETQDKESANLLTDALINRVIKGGTRFDEEASYDFFIPHRLGGENLRIALIDWVKNKFDESDQAAAGRVDEAFEAERLNVYFVGSNTYLANTCVFEPGSKGSKAFHLQYHENNEVSMAVLNKASLDHWFETFFYPVYIARNDSYRLEPIGPTKPFADRQKLAYLKAA